MRPPLVLITQSKCCSGVRLYFVFFIFLTDKVIGSLWSWNMINPLVSRKWIRKMKNPPNFFLTQAGFEPQTSGLPSWCETTAIPLNTLLKWSEKYFRWEGVTVGLISTLYAFSGFNQVNRKTGKGMEPHVQMSTSCVGLVCLVVWYFQKYFPHQINSTVGWQLHKDFLPTFTQVSFCWPYNRT